MLPAMVTEGGVRIRPGGRESAHGKQCQNLTRRARRRSSTGNMLNNVLTGNADNNTLNEAREPIRWSGCWQ
jgi:hypothetical protein